MVRIEIVIMVPGVSDPDCDKVSQIVDTLNEECDRIADTIGVPPNRVWIDDVLAETRTRI